MASVKKTSKSRLGSLRLSDRGGDDLTADWNDADCKLLQNCIALVAKLGGAIRFGYTRDGGAYSVGVYLDDDRETFYCKPSEDVDDFLRHLVGKLESLE